MGKIIDLTNQKFNKLTVLEKTNERRNRQVVWKCQCDCGNITYVVSQALRSGHTKSCGCLNHQKNNDLIGKQFGDFTVISRSEKNLNGKTYWNCQCLCGEIETILGTELRNGEKTSCSKCRKNYFLLNPFKNHKGEKYGLLTVLEPTEKRFNGKIVWKCQCDCGNICEVNTNSLISGNTQSCGCLSKKSLNENIINNYLIENNINFKRQQSFDNCLSPKDSKLLFDFALYKDNKIIGLIEYDGVQHFQPIEYFGGEDGFQYLQICDNIKNNYAKKHKIPLFRITYKENTILKLTQILDALYGSV